MYRGTNPTIEVSFDFEASLLEEFYATFRQKAPKDEDCIEFEKTLDDCEVSGTSVFVPLTQEETLSLKAGIPLQMQCRVKLSDGTVDATDPVSFTIKNIFKDGEI